MHARDLKKNLTTYYFSVSVSLDLTKDEDYKAHGMRVASSFWCIKPAEQTAEGRNGTYSGQIIHTMNLTQSRLVPDMLVGEFLCF